MANGNLVVTRVVPGGAQKFYFSQRGGVFIDEQQASVELE